MSVDTMVPGWLPSDENAEHTFKASEAANIGDLLWWDSTNNVMRSATVFTDQGSATATQEAFAAVFAGVAMSNQRSTDTVAENARVYIDRIYEFPCTSSTFQPGDYVAPAYLNPGLNPQSLVKVTDPTLAIGRVVKYYGTATANVKVRLTASTLVGRYLEAGQPGQAGSGWNNFRNVIDGGDFTINPWQRGTSFSGVANTNTYTADRWFAQGGASSSISVSQQAQTDVLGFGNSLRWGRGGGSNTATIYLGQVIESADSIRLQGRQVTLSFWAKGGAQFSAAGAALGVQLVSSSTAGNDTAAHLVANSNNWNAANGGVNVFNTTCVLPINTTPTRFSFTGEVPANCTQLGLLFYYAPTGTNNTTDTVDFYGVQLEDGGVASDFEHRDIQVELELCQRYFFQFTEPANTVPVVVGMVNVTNTQAIILPLPVQMRAAPTVTVVAGSFKINVAGVATAVGAGFAAGTTHTPNYVSVVDNLTATVGQAVMLQGGGGAGSIAVSADF